MTNFSHSEALPIFDVGIGLRREHFSFLKENTPPLGFLEVHPENYFFDGPHVEKLEHFSNIYPISFHGIGLSLGSHERVSSEHLKQLKKLIDKIKPAMVSDHASWSSSGNAHSNDLLPLPYNKESLKKLCDNIKRTQDFLSRRILIENPSTYLEFHSTMQEPEFLMEASRITGCGILFDLNNIFVNFINHGNCPYYFIDYIDAAAVGEVHLAGHSTKEIEGKEFRIDTHSQVICDEVWDLYRYFISCCGYKNTLIEWDVDIPQAEVLLQEVDKARKIAQEAEKNAA